MPVDLTPVASSVISYPLGSLVNEVCWDRSEAQIELPTMRSRGSSISNTRPWDVKPRWKCQKHHLLSPATDEHQKTSMMDGVGPDLTD